MNVSDLDFFLPDELIAQQPADRRDASRMLMVNRATGDVSDGHFSDIIEQIRADDVIVVNNTRVFPARLFGKSETGAAIEIFLIKEQESGVWESLARPARRLSPGKRIIFSEELSAVTIGRTESGGALIRFDAVEDLYEELERVGQTPLPPYIKRPDGVASVDRERYQTVYAAERGAIAAPTAGLHFTPEILNTIRGKGNEIVELTLHVGYGTFEPIRADDLADHRVAPETYSISESAATTLNAARSAGRRVIAVGTTSTRALEDNLARSGDFKSGKFAAELTVTPGYEFRAINGLLTNFHLPKSSLLLLTSTFGGYDTIMNAYRHAVEQRYRFYSYGDCMLII